MRTFERGAGAYVMLLDFLTQILRSGNDEKADNIFGVEWGQSAVGV